jgi:hypothetical protein
MLIAKLVLLIFLINITRTHSQCPTVIEPAPNCFTQENFDDAIAKATDNIEFMESALKNSTNIEGFCVAKSDPTYHHFHPVDVTSETLSNNQAALIGISAIQELKKEFNLTKSQLQICMKNISSTGFCKPLKANCDPAETKLVF